MPTWTRQMGDFDRTHSILNMEGCSHFATLCGCVSFKLVQLSLAQDSSKGQKKIFKNSTISFSLAKQLF